MSDWSFLNRYRLRFGPLGSTEEDGFNGVFSLPMDGEARRVCVVASDGMGWRHVSVSFGNTSRKTPSWEVMSWVKSLFWNEEDWVVEFHPAKSEYVNQHEGCLHLWQPTDQKMPTPPSIMVGIKTP